MNFHKFLIIILLLLLLSFFLEIGRFQGFAQETDLKEICQSIEKIEAECVLLSETKCRELLEQCEAYTREEINQYEEDITKTEQEKRTLQNQIYILNQTIKKLDLQIYQGNVMVKDLGFQIDDTETSIEETSLKIRESRNQLANILQFIYEADQKSLIEILLSEEELSDFFDDLMALEALNLEGQKLLENIEDLKTRLEGEKESLAEEKEELENLIIIQTLQKKESSGVKEDKSWLLKLTEAEYQKYLKEKEEVEKRATEIRSRIFELIGVPEAPTFGEAYEIARYVSSLTGIRPALLLAVLTQESNIGKNVGQCYLVDTNTGEGVRITNNTRESRTMNPERDLPYFLEICSRLGRNPLNTPVSCPMKDKWGRPVGWGGAMGPAQFIPETWAHSKYGYGKKVEEITGKVSDPWDIKDAFLAAGLYLRDLGGVSNEFRAVMRYFSGSSWKSWEEFYGKSVLSIAKRYEQDIAELETTL